MSVSHRRTKSNWNQIITSQDRKSLFSMKKHQYEQVTNQALNVAKDGFNWEIYLLCCKIPFWKNSTSQIAHFFKMQLEKKIYFLFVLNVERLDLRKVSWKRWFKCFTSPTSRLIHWGKTETRRQSCKHRKGLDSDKMGIRAVKFTNRGRHRIACMCTQ